MERARSKLHQGLTSRSIRQMKETEFYAAVLGVTMPWKVEAVDLALEKGEVVVTVATNEVRCPECNRKCSKHDSRKRRWRHLDTCQYQTILAAEIPRANCPEHGVQQIHVPWSEPGSKFTLLFEAMIILWLKDASVNAVALRFGMAWSAVNDIMKAAVARGLARRSAVHPTRICVDETSFQKRHEYVTVVTDHDDSRVLFVADDRKATSLEGFYETLSAEQKAAIRSVSMDMHAPYVKATRAHIPDADCRIAFDKFHIAQKLGDAVNRVRRDENKALRAEGDDRLAGTRFLWITNPNNLSKSDWDDKFEHLRESALKTARAWALKEGAMAIWHYTSRTWAEKAWGKWIGWAQRSRLDPMVKVAKTVKNHMWGIVNAVIHGVTNATAEGVNSGIQRLKNRACGYRSRDAYRTAIYFHFGKLDLLPDGVSAHTN